MEQLLLIPGEVRVRRDKRTKIVCAAEEIVGRDFKIIGEFNDDIYDRFCHLSKNFSEKFFGAVRGGGVIARF